MKDLETRIGAIEERNKKVEQDKAWETSWVRRLSVAALTYMVVVAYLLAISNDKPFVNALVPVAGYLLSTMVLKSIRNFWQS